jgi:hypothetical protein
MDFTPHHAAVSKALRRLDSILEQFVAGLAHGSVTIQLENPAGGSEVRQAAEAFAAINYGMEDRPAETVQCVGVMGVSADLRRRAEAVNEAKAALKAVCAPLQDVYVRVPTKGESSPTKGIPAIRMILRNLQRSDLNLLAAYRKIPLLEVPPASITFTRALTRAIYRKSVEDLYIILSTADSAKASGDRARLQSLDARETHLALVKARYQNTRANIVNARLDARGRGRFQIRAELPVLYVQGKRPPPEVRFPVRAAEMQTLKRSRTSQIEAQPFLQTLPVYRYLPR